MTETASTACPGDRYISHALSVGIFDTCLACSLGQPEEGLVRATSPNKASLSATQKPEDGAS
jgi:hypothetical protein